MLDEGSTITLISKSITRQIDVKGPKFTLSLRGVNDFEGIKVESERVDFEIKTCFGSFLVKNAVAVEKLLSQTLSPELTSLCESKLNIQLKPYDNITPILLGQDNWNLIVSKEIRTLPNHFLRLRE